VQSLAVFYGRNRSDYYFTEGLPLLLTTALPFAMLGMWKALRSPPKNASKTTKGEQEIHFVFAMAIIISILTLSLISHKEVRFVFPLLPMLHILAAKPLATFFTPVPTLSKRPLRLLLLILAITANVGIMYYTTYVHQRGVIDVMHYLRHDYEENLSSGLNTTVGFLMPCHSTPWRSHLVYPRLYAWALTCHPPLNLGLEQRKAYLDEADIFYADPVAWIRETMQATCDANSKRGTEIGLRPWPEYLVFFEQLEPTMTSVLGHTAYKECWRGFNTHWHDDWRREGNVVVWCLPSGNNS
jgi:GPI mannosyltransferase 3